MCYSRQQSRTEDAMMLGNSGESLKWRTFSSFSSELELISYYSVVAAEPCDTACGPRVLLSLVRKTMPKTKTSGKS